MSKGYLLSPNEDRLEVAWFRRAIGDGLVLKHYLVAVVRSSLALLDMPVLLYRSCLIGDLISRALLLNVESLTES